MAADTGTEIAHVDNAAVARRENDDVMSIIAQAALNPSIDAAKMDQLFALQDRVFSRDARLAYYRSLAAMHKELPAVQERGRGHNNAKYAKWEDIQAAITPVLGKHGFALSFRTKVADKIVVTAILAHEDGHTEETELPLAIDNSGAKNAVQAVGSSISYGMRYTACALLNIQTGVPDDDGAAAGGSKFITDAQAATLQSSILNSGGTVNAFLKSFQIDSLADLPADKLESANQRIKMRAAKAAQKAQEKAQ